MADFLSPSMEVATAMSAGRPVVALESSVWVQGLPWPANWEAAQQVEKAVRDEGVVPALIWVDGGLIHYGLGGPELQELCRNPRGQKLNVADLPAALAGKRAGSTTVSASLRAAELLGLKVFATGGIGGVHRGWQQHPDLSADLIELARTPLLTVSAGVKCVLDLDATLEAIETLAIPVWRYATDTFPEFYCRGSRTYGNRLDSPAEIAEAYRLCKQILGRGGLVVQDPPSQVEPKLLSKWLHKGLSLAPKGGKNVTPFLLEHLAKASQGQTLQVNTQLLVQNARLAAQVAKAISGVPVG